MNQIPEQEIRINSEDLKNTKLLTEKQKEALKELPERLSNTKVKKSTDQAAREFNRTQQRLFNDSELHGKLMIIFGSFVKGITSYIKDLIIYLTALSSVFYLYYKFENESTEKLYPKESNKFPYVYVDDKLDYEAQFNLTTINLKDNDNNLYEPIYYKIDNEDTNEQIKNKINQPENATVNDMDRFAKFFNAYSNDKKPYEINILQIMAHALLSGILGINSFYYFVHENILKNLYFMDNGLNSSSDEKNSTTEKFIKNAFGSLLIIGITTVLFFLFRLSKNDLSDLLTPFIDQSVIKSKVQNIFGLEEILNFFSSLFAGFFTGFKLLFIVSFVVFITTSLMSLYKLSSSVSNLSSIFIIFTVVISYFSSVIFFGLYVVDILRQNRGFSSNDLFNSIFNVFVKYLNSFKTFIETNPIVTQILDSLDSKKNSNTGIFSTAITILTIMLMLPFLPIFLIFLFAIILTITFSFTPILASFYMGTKLAFDTTVQSIFKIGNFTRKLSKQYIPIIISFILCFSVLLNKIESRNIVTLIESILNILMFTVTILLILYFGKYGELRFQEKDAIVEEMIKKMSPDEIEKISGKEPTKASKKEKLKAFVKENMKEKVKEMLYEKTSSFVTSALQSLAFPGISSIGVGMFYIVDQINKYKSQISNLI